MAFLCFEVVYSKGLYTNEVVCAMWTFLFRYGWEGTEVDAICVG